MYHFESEPPSQHRNRDNCNQAVKRQTLPPPPLIFGGESSPTPSSEHSTLTSNSFQSSIGDQQQQQQQATNNNTNDCNLLLSPHTAAGSKGKTVAFACHPSRHSSSSIDHKTLHLTRFADQHRHGKGSTFGARNAQPPSRQTSAEPAHYRAPLPGEQYAIDAKRSNSFRQHNLAPSRTGARSSIGAGNAKRSSVNFAHSSSPVRFCSSFQRHFSTPVPPPRAPTDDEDTSICSSSYKRVPSPLQGARQTAPQQPASSSNNNAAKLTRDRQLTMQQADELNSINSHNNQALLARLEQQPHGSDSLDNINMIVDEDNRNSFANEHNVTPDEPHSTPLASDRFMFMTSDEPYQMSTLRVATSSSRPKKPASESAGFGQVGGVQAPVVGLQRQEAQHGAGSNQLHMIEADRKMSASTNATCGSDIHSYLNGVEHTAHTIDLSMQQQPQQQLQQANFAEQQTRHQEMQNTFGVQCDQQMNHQHQQQQAMLIYDTRK